MPIPITIPRLGWSMEEGTFGEWLKAPGDLVRAGEMVFVLEGEKAAHEIESFDTGILCVPADAPQTGETVIVGQVVGFLLAEGEPAPTTVGRPPVDLISKESASAPSSPPAPTPPAGEAGPPRRAAGPAARRLARERGIDLNTVVTPDPTGRVIPEDVLGAGSSGRGLIRAAHAVASPRARRRAGELGVDWRQLRGTGRNGRIRERDVVAHAQTAGGAAPAAPSPSMPAPTSPGQFHPATKVRRTLAQRMVAGIHQTAPVTLTTKVDAAALVALRNAWKTSGTGAVLPSYNDLLVKLVATALREQPALNACWHADGIWQYDDVHVALAVDTEGGLVAPVIPDADRLTVFEIAACSQQLIEQARAGSLSQNQLQGGTFTVTNLGMFDVDHFTPIINLPQAGILGVGRIVTEPVVRDEQIVVGQTLSLSLTFDHRVVDGAPAARWLERLCALIRSADETLDGSAAPA